MANTYTCHAPGCDKDYPTEAARNACWTSHCTHPESHDAHKAVHRGQQSDHAEE